MAAPTALLYAEHNSACQVYPEEKRHKVSEHIRSFCDRMLSLMTHPVRAVLLSRVELVEQFFIQFRVDL